MASLSDSDADAESELSLSLTLDALGLVPLDLDNLLTVFIFQESDSVGLASLPEILLAPLSENYYLLMLSAFEIGKSSSSASSSESSTKLSGLAALKPPFLAMEDFVY